MAFYRRPRTLFKGFKVPDWATAEKTHGWEADAYSRQAWENAMHDLNSEWTPMQFAGERMEPNVIEWFRLEQWGKGNSSRLFYNEVPKPTWFRHGGHLDSVERDVYSFTHGDLEQRYLFGIDTTTPEGRTQFKKEIETLSQLAPELIKKDDYAFPHEVPAAPIEEPHFRRVWQHYRDHVFRVRVSNLYEAGEISEADLKALHRFTGSSKQPLFSQYLYAKLGQLPHLQQDPDFQATERVLDKMGLKAIEINKKTAQPFEEQFWEQYDLIQDLNEEELRRELPLFVTDPSNQAAIEAILTSRDSSIGEEHSKKLAA